MGWLTKIIKEVFRLPSDEEKRKRKDRYSPGKMEDYFPKSMEQPAKMFKKTFGNHHDDKGEWKSLVVLPPLQIQLERKKPFGKVQEAPLP